MRPATATALVVPATLRAVRAGWRRRKEGSTGCMGSSVAPVADRNLGAGSPFAAKVAPPGPGPDPGLRGNSQRAHRVCEARRRSIPGMNSKLWWYAARANGLVAWGLVAASMLWGLALSTKVGGGRPRPAWLLDLHRFLGGAAVVFTGIHVVSILLDSYTHFGLVNVLVPLTGGWHPLAVAWGIAAMYLLVAVEVTSLLRARISTRAWRLGHYLSFPLFVVATVHVLSAGTDRANPLVRWGVLGIAALAAALTARRASQANVAAGELR